MAVALSALAAAGNGPAAPDGGAPAAWQAGWDAPEGAPPAGPLPALLLPPASATDYCGSNHRITGPNRATLHFNEPWHVWPNDGRYRDIAIDGDPRDEHGYVADRGRPLEGACANRAGHYIQSCPSEYVSVVFRGNPVYKDATGWMEVHRDQFNSIYSCSDWMPTGTGTSETAVVLHDGQAPDFQEGSASYLDLDGGYVHLQFDEPLSIESVLPGNLSVGYHYRFWEVEEIRLGGAAASGGATKCHRDSGYYENRERTTRVVACSGAANHVRLDLTPEQTGRVARMILGSPYIAQFGGDLPREILGTRASGVFAAAHGQFATDLAGNRALFHSQFPAIALRPDLVPPGLEGTARLDMGSGVLGIGFNSSMDAARTAGDLSGIVVRGPGGVAVSLAGAGAPDASGRILNVTLAPVHVLAAARAAAEAPFTVDVPAGTFFDHSGNAFAGAAGHGLEVARDTARPTLDASAAPALHLASGRLALAFNETMDASSAVPGRLHVTSALHGEGSLSVDLDGAAVDAAAHGRSIALTLTQAQRAEIAEYHKRPTAGGGGPGIQVHAGAGAFADLSGNPLLPAAAPLAVDPLGVPPLLRTGPAGPPPALNLSSGTLSLAFDEAVDVAAADASAVAIRAGEWRVALGGADVRAAAAPAGQGGAGIEVALTRAQRDAAASALSREGAPSALLDVGDSAFRGAAPRGVAYPGASGLPLSVAPDGDPPALAAAVRPSLDTGSRKLTVVFGETVDASSANASLFYVEGLGGEARMSLAGAAPSTADSTALVITLTAAQDARAIETRAAAGGLRLDIGAGAVSDLAGNPVQGVRGIALDVQADRGRPHLAGAPVIDVANGLLTITLHEYIDVSEVHPRLMIFSYWPNSRVLLGGSQVATTEDGPSFTLKLTPGQHDQIARHAGRGMTLTIGDGAITDLSGNRIARSGTNSFRLVNTMSDPGIAGPPAVQHLNMSAGTATFRFNETMDASRTDPSLVSIAVPGADPVPLGGAEARTIFVGKCGFPRFDSLSLLGEGANRLCGSDVVSLALTAGQMAALSRALAGSGGEGAGTAYANISAGAFADSLGHAMSAPAPRVPMAVEADSLGPAREGTLRDELPLFFYPGGNTGGLLWRLDLYNRYHGIEPALPVLNMSAGTLEFALDELVAAASADPSKVSVSGAAGGSPVSLGRAAGPPADTGRPALRLTADLKASIASLNASSGPVQIDLAAGAFADLWGNPSLPMPGLRPVVVADAVGPAPDPRHPPVLDLADGTLSVWLDEYVDGSRTDPSRVSLAVAAAGASPLVVRPGAGPADAAAGAGGSDHAELALSPAQKAAVALAVGGAPGTAALDAQAGAFSDAAGNPSAPAQGVRVVVRGDDRPPALAGPAPLLLDLSAGTLRFAFDEHVDASAANPYAVSLTNLTGGDRTQLGGASVVSPPPSPDAVVVRLAPEHVGAAARLAAAGQLRVDAAEGAFADLSGNAFAGATGLAAPLAPDSEPPRLLAAAAGAHGLDLGSARLELAFDENVDAPAVNASGIRVATRDGLGPGPLRGAAVEQAWPGTSVSVRLTAAQAAAAAWAHRHSDEPLAANVTAAAGVADLAGNPLAATAAAVRLSVAEHGASALQPLIGPHYYLQARSHALDEGSAQRSAGMPGHVAAGPGGIYVSDAGDDVIEVIGPGPRAARSSIAAAGWLESVGQIAVLPNGTVAALSSGHAEHGNLTMVDASGSARAFRAGSGSGDDPRALAAGPNGTLVVGSEDNRVRVFDAATGARLLEFGGAGAAGGAPGGLAFSNITGVAAGGPNGTIAVLDGTTGRVQAYRADGAFLAAVGNATAPAGAGPGQFDRPSGVAVGPGGRIFVADAGNGRIQAFGPGGAFAAEFGLAAGGGPAGHPASIAAGPGSRLFVAGAAPAGAGPAVVAELERFDPPNVRAVEPDGAYGEGRSVRIAAEFDVPVRVAGPNASLALDAGETAAAWYVSGNNTATLEFVYHVGRGDASGDLDALSLNVTGEGGRIVAGGHKEVPGLLAGPGEPRSLSRNSGIEIETVRPAVTRVTAGVPDGLYGRGAQIPVSVWFSEPVAAASATSLALATDDGPGAGTTAVRANGTVQGARTLSVNFTYSVGPGDDAARLGYASAASLTADDPAGVSDRAGNRANLTLPAPGADGSLREGRAIQVIGTILHAAVESAAITGGNEMTVAYSAALDAALADYGNLTLSSGGRPPLVSLAGSGTAEHTVVFGGPPAGDDDTATVDIAALRGNSNHHSFPGAAGLHVADGQRPSVASATAVSPDRIAVTFTEPVSAPEEADPSAAWVLSGPSAAGLAVSRSPAIDNAASVELALSGNVSGTAPNMSLSYVAAAGGVSDLAGDPMADEGPVRVADAIPPQFAAAVTAPDRIAVTFTEPVSAPEEADPSAAWVLSGPSAAGLAVSRSPAIANSGSAVLGLSANVSGTAPNMSLSYVAAAGGAADAAGNRMGAAGPVRVADALPPVLRAAAVSPDRIAVTFSEPVTETGAGADPAAAWPLSGPDSAGLSVSSSPAVHGARSVLLGLSGNVSGTAPDMRLSYDAAAGNASDEAGNRAASSGPSRVADALPPLFTAAATAPNLVAVAFSEPVTAAEPADPAAAWALSGPSAAGLSVSRSPAIDGALSVGLGLSGNVSGTAPALYLSHGAAAGGGAADAAGNAPVPAAPAGPEAAAAAVADGLAPRILHAEITGPLRASVQYSEPVRAGPGAYGPVHVDGGGPRPVEGVSGNGTDGHTVRFGGEPAAADSTGSITVDAAAVADLASPRPNALGPPGPLDVRLDDGQRPRLVSAAVTGPRTAAVLYDEPVSAPGPGGAQPAYSRLVVDGAAREITGSRGLGGSAEHVLEFGGPPAGTGATGSVDVDPERVSSESSGPLGSGARIEVALADGQAPRVLSANVSGPHRATVAYSEPVWAGLGSYLNLTVGGVALPAEGLSGDGTAMHAIELGGAPAAANSTGSMAVDAAAVADLASPRPHALGPPGQLAVRLGDGQGPPIESARITGPSEVTVRYAEPAAAAPGAYSSLFVGGSAREIAGSTGLGGSAEHVLVFGGAPAAGNGTGSVSVDPSLVADGGGAPMGTGAPFAHALDDGQAPSVLSAAVTGPRSVAVLYSEPVWAGLESYLNLTVGGEARPVEGLSGDGTARHVVRFGGAPSHAGAAGTIAIRAAEVLDRSLPEPNALGASDVRIALAGADEAGATADAVFAGPNRLRIEYSAPLGPPDAHEGPVYGEIRAAGMAAAAAPADGGVSGVWTAVHTVRFGGPGVHAGQSGSIALNTDLVSAPGADPHVFHADAIPVRAGASVRTVEPAGGAPAVAIEPDGFTRAVDATAAGDAASPSVNVSALAAGPAAGGGGGGGRALTVEFPAEGVRIAASFAEVAFPPNATARMVPADGILVLRLATGAGVPGTAEAAAAFGLASGDLAGPPRVVEVGDPGVHIVFDRPVRIQVNGQAGALAFYVNGTDGSVVPIRTECGADDAAAVHGQLNGSGECQTDSGADKAIHTYHLTLFGTVARADGGAGGGAAGESGYSLTGVMTATLVDGRPGGGAGAPPPAAVAQMQLPGGQFPGGGSGGAGGGGGSGARLAPAGAGAVTIYGAAWDCREGAMRITVNAGISPEVSVLSSEGAAAAQRAAGPHPEGRTVYEAPLPGDPILSIRAVLAEGRTVSVATEDVRTGGQCAGEAVFAQYGAGADAAARADADADADRLPPAADPDAPPQPPPPDAQDARPGADLPPADRRDGQADAPPAADPDAPPPPPADAPPAADPDAPPPAGVRDAASDPDDAVPGGGGGGGCLIATAAHGTELAPQVQRLRELRDSTILSTESGRAFMSAFGAAYYAFSPQVADLEREHPAFRQAVAALAAPMLHALQVVDAAEPGSELGVAAYGALAIALAAGMYAAAPAYGAWHAARLAGRRRRCRRSCV